MFTNSELNIVKRGTLAVLLIFLCGISVNKISPCGVAVISNPMVCDVCVFKPMVFGETKCSTFFLFHLWQNKI